MSLTDAAIRSTKSRLKPYKVAAGGGLYLLINPNGSRWWRFKYRVSGKEKLLSLGVYPEVSLKLARERRDESRRQLANGSDPSAKRKAEKVAQADSFEAVAREWFTKFSVSWAESHSSKVLRRLEMDRCATPWLFVRVDQPGCLNLRHEGKRRPADSHGWRCCPAPLTPGAESFSASTCISSSARIISDSDICDQRRICSRRAPCHVVRLQSIPSGSGLSVGIVVLSGTQLVDIGAVLRPTRFLFHSNQSGERYETDRKVVVERCYQRASVFFVEGKRLRHEDVY
jgi:hypothetical protein